MEFRLRVGGVLQKIGLPRKLNDESFIATCWSVEHLVDKCDAGHSFVVNGIALAEAGVEQQSESQWNITA